MVDGRGGLSVRKPQVDCVAFVEVGDAAHCLSVLVAGEHPAAAAKILRVDHGAERDHALGRARHYAVGRGTQCPGFVSDLALGCRKPMGGGRAQLLRLDVDVAPNGGERARGRRTQQLRPGGNVGSLPGDAPSKGRGGGLGLAVERAAVVAPLALEERGDVVQLGGEDIEAWGPGDTSSGGL